MSRNYIVTFPEELPANTPIKVYAIDRHHALRKVTKAVIESEKEQDGVLQVIVAGDILREKRESFRWDLKITWDYVKPWLLDTPEKVLWANAVLEKRGYKTPHWRLGDHCWYQPAKLHTG